MIKPRIIGGSVPGMWHLLPGSNPWLKKPGWLNNQDAFAWKIGKECFAAAVSDGCSSRPHTEIGSAIIANVLPKLLLACAEKHLRKSPDQNFAPWEDLGRGLLAHIDSLAKSMTGSYNSVIYDNFLATFVAVLSMPADTYIIAAGDGYFAINEQLERIGPFPDDNPPYLGYHLTGDISHASLIPFIKRFSTADMRTILLGTDGLEYLSPISHKDIPGTSTKVGTWQQFLEPQMFRSSQALEQRLVEIQNAFMRESLNAQKPLGLLDDTAVVSIKIKK